MLNYINVLALSQLNKKKCPGWRSSADIRLQRERNKNTKATGHALKEQEHQRDGDGLPARAPGPVGGGAALEGVAVHELAAGPHHRRC